MQKLIFTGLLLAAPSAFAIDGANYKCGPYEVEFVGPDTTTLVRGEKILGHWEKEGSDPTEIVGDKLFLRWNKKMYLCHEKASQ